MTRDGVGRSDRRRPFDRAVDAFCSRDGLNAMRVHVYRVIGARSRQRPVQRHARRGGDNGGLTVMFRVRTVSRPATCGARRAAWSLSLRERAETVQRERDRCSCSSPGQTPNLGVWPAGICRGSAYDVTVVTLSVIVPATDNPATIAVCCSALRTGASTPDELVVVQEPRHVNAAAARNLGARRAGGSVLLFVDADVEVRADAIERIRSRFEADPGLTALFGSYDDSPSAPGVVSGFRNLLHHHVHQNAPGPATTFWTGLGAVRREAFESIGGFDETVEFMEDIDLGMRLSAVGARIELDPLVQGKHLKRWSVWSMIRTDFIGRGVPWVRLLLRHRGSTTALNLGWRHRLSALAALTGSVSLLRRDSRGTALSAVTLVALNRSFYALLWRRRGATAATAGVFLHALHHLASTAAVPVGLLLHLLDALRRRR
jgi:hypothetical protein